MKMNLLMALSALVSFSVLAAADLSTPAPVPQAPVQGMVNCTNLSMEEQQFANQMTDMNNRSQFCAKMTSDQRRAVMDMAKKPNASGVMMTPDQTMHQYMQQNNMMAPPGQMGGACPVK